MRYDSPQMLFGNLIVQPSNKLETYWYQLTNIKRTILTFHIAVCLPFSLEKFYEEPDELYL